MLPVYRGCPSKIFVFSARYFLFQFTPPKPIAGLRYLSFIQIAFIKSQNDCKGFVVVTYLEENQAGIMAASQRIAIVSVYDKTGLLDLAKGLIDNNVRILASGGTARMIRESGFPVE